MQSKTNVVDWFREQGFAEYGSVVLRTELLEFVGIEIPKYGTKKDFDKAALAEIEVVQYLRNILLREGKYLKQDGDFYRVLLPSQNAQQVESYMRTADKKLKRATLLLRNTPVEHQPVDDTNVRLYMKQDSIKYTRKYGQVPVQDTVVH